MRFTYAEALTDASYYLPLAQAAEAAGYSSMTVADSLVYPPPRRAAWRACPAAGRAPRVAAGVHPAVAPSYRAAQGGLGVAADQDRDRLGRGRCHLHGADVEELAVELEPAAGGQPAYDVDALVHPPAAPGPGHALTAKSSGRGESPTPSPSRLRNRIVLVTAPIAAINVNVSMNSLSSRNSRLPSPV